MKTKSDKNSDRGFVLFATMMVAMLIAVLAGGAMMRGRLLSTAAIQLQLNAQTEWDAQSGLEQAEALFLNNEFKNSFTADSGASVSIDEGTTVGNTTTYDVTSVAQSRDGQTTVSLNQQFDVELSPPPVGCALPDLLIGLIPEDLKSPICELKNNTVLEGTEGQNNAVYVLGSLSTDKDMDLNYLDLFITGSIQGSGTTGEAQVEVIQEVPEEITETINGIVQMMAEFDETIGEGVKEGLYVEDDKGKTTKEISVNNGGTYVLNGGKDVTYKKVDTINIQGQGTLIIDGNFSLENGPTINIDEDITVLINGDFKSKNQTVINTGKGVFYIRGKAEMKEAATINAAGGFFVRDDVKLENQADFNGFFITQGKIEIKNRLTLQGMLLADEMKLKNRAEITLNRDLMPEWLYTLLGNRDLLFPIFTDDSPRLVERVIRSEWKHL